MYNAAMKPDTVEFAKALADETRQEIMHHLCCQWLNVTDLVERLGGRVNQPTVSHHLKRLAQAGLVLERRAGRHRYYTLDQERVAQCCRILAIDFAPQIGGDSRQGSR